MKKIGKISAYQSNQLKNYFAKESKVAMAFLFGSFAKGQALYDSDVDIAVYFWPKSRIIEWEEEIFYPEEDKIWRETENILQRDIDLIVLNRISSRVVYKVLRTGLPIIIKDRNLYWKFFLLIDSVGREFKKFIRDYRRIRERSKSLSEEDKEKLEDMIDFLGEEIKSYEEFQNLTQSLYESERSQKRNVEHWIESIVLNSVDIAEIILASEKIHLPEKYKDILKSFSLLKDFDKEKAEKLSRFAELRNIITHEYLDIKWQRIQMFIKTSRPLYEYLIDFVKKNYIS